MTPDATTPTDNVVEIKTADDLKNAQATDSTVFKQPTHLPPWFWNKRNRAINRAKLDKTRRNQRALRICRNAWKRDPAAAEAAGIFDSRLDPTCRNEFATTKPMFRGAKDAARAMIHEARLLENIDDQRIRGHKYNEATRAATEAYLNAPGEMDEVEIARAHYEALTRAHNEYHRIAPVTPYVTLAERTRIELEAFARKTEGGGLFSRDFPAANNVTCAPPEGAHIIRGPEGE